MQITRIRRSAPFSARWFALLSQRAAMMVLVHGCTDATRSGGSNQGLGAARARRDAGPTGAAPGPSRDKCSVRPGPIVCDASKAASVPWGAVVTVGQGEGSPPKPSGGIVEPGPYQLIAETLYGVVPPEQDRPLPGDGVQGVLSFDCDVANELSTWPINNHSGVRQLGAGNSCHRLVTRSIPLVEVTGWTNDEQVIPDARNQASYTADGERLTLILLYPYLHFSTGAVLGSYTVVDEYVSAATKMIRRPSDAGAPTPNTGETTPERDPRCPATTPSNGDRCNPQPAPLECEYGGDPFGRCTTLAECALNPDGSFRFFALDPGPCTPPNPAACPASFEDATALTRPDDPRTHTSPPPVDPSLIGQACYYAEGACSCSDPESHQTNMCDWNCRSGMLINQGTKLCPWPRSFAGDGCGDEGMQCTYDEPCHPAESLGPSLICQQGHWAQFGGIAFGCPPQVVSP